MSEWKCLIHGTRMSAETCRRKRLWTVAWHCRSASRHLSAWSPSRQNGSRAA